MPKIVHLLPLCHMLHTAYSVEDCWLAVQAIAEWGRADPPPYVIRLRLLLHEVSHSPQYTTRVQDVALDAGSLSARVAAMAADNSASPRTAGIAGTPGSGTARSDRPGGVTTAAAETDYVDKLSKGVVLGTPRMPVSDRIAAAVMKHGKANGEVVRIAESDEEDFAADGEPETAAS